MKFAVKFTALGLLLLSLAGCVSSGGVHGASPITAHKPFDLDLIWVKTSSSLGGLEAEKRTLSDSIVSGLRETGLFKVVSTDKAEIGSGSGIAVTADIKKIKEVSKDERSWAGAMAGRARVRIQVTVSDLNFGSQIETFEADGESSGGSDLAGTTDEAIQRAAEGVVSQVLKINEQTAE